jgi:hypothetical protein
MSPPERLSQKHSSRGSAESPLGRACGPCDSRDRRWHPPRLNGSAEGKRILLEVVGPG